MRQLRCLLMSVAHAGQGIASAIAHERNLRIHLCAVCFVVLFGIWQGLSAGHWVIELLCCGLVISLELVNTGLEAACDALSTAPNPSIRLAKDASAGAVLVSAVTSVIVWLVLLLGTDTYKAHLADTFRSGLLPGICLLLWAAGTVVFVFVPENKNRTKDRKL